MARTRRVKAVSLDPELLGRAEAKATQMHMGFSEYVRSLVRADLGMNGDVPQVITGPAEAVAQIRHEVDITAEGPASGKPVTSRRIASSLGGSTIAVKDCTHPIGQRIKGTKICGACGGQAK